MDYVDHNTFRIILEYSSENAWGNLMKTCKKFRDFIGKSDIWEKNQQFVTGWKIYKVKEAFQMFTSLAICKTGFALQPYYEKWYYMFILKMWFCKNNHYWSIYSIVYNNGDISKIRSMFKLLDDYINMSYYLAWMVITPALVYNLSKITDVGKDEIIKRLYVVPSKYDSEKCEILIVNESMKSQQVFNYKTGQHIFGRVQGQENTNLYYLIRHIGGWSFEICRGDKLAKFYAMGSFIEKIKKISDREKMNAVLLTKIIFVIMSQDSSFRLTHFGVEI